MKTDDWSFHCKAKIYMKMPLCLNIPVHMALRHHLHHRAQGRRALWKTSIWTMLKSRKTYTYGEKKKRKKKGGQAALYQQEFNAWNLMAIVTNDLEGKSVINFRYVLEAP